MTVLAFVLAAGWRPERRGQERMMLLAIFLCVAVLAFLLEILEG